jgi:acyl-CoA thioesterase FadM
MGKFRQDTITSAVDSWEPGETMKAPLYSITSGTTLPPGIDGLPLAQTPEIQWLTSGQPILQGAGVENVGVSLSHDEQFCLCVSGYGRQGCDIAPITQRSPQDWIALLSFKRELLLQQLLARGVESIDQAATRIWAALEALRKATQAMDIDLVLERSLGENVLFRGLVAGQSLSVLTFPVKLTRNPQRMVAVVVNSTPISSPPQTTVSTPLQKLIWRWPVGYKETATISQNVYFSYFFHWMGQVRDRAIQPIRHTLGEYLKTGRWGMVTNRSQVEIFGDLGLQDQVEVHFWVQEVSGSTVNFGYDWFRVTEQEIRAKIAHSTLTMTWTEISPSQGSKIHPLPQFLADFMAGLYEPIQTSPVPSLFSLGKELYRGHYPREKGKLLRQESFLTSLEETDAIGNINFAIYSDWQGRLRDRFGYSLVPEFYGRSGQRGEFRCLRSQIDYLREALPFEEIHVSMQLRAVFERGMTLGFEYFRQDAAGNFQKLAVGEQDVIWLLADQQGQFQPSFLPSTIQDAF